jgi:hypothetical protein
VVVFPLVSAIISLVCAGAIARDALVRPRPDKIAWAIAFAIFAIAAGAEVAGSLTHWTPALARVYYLTGAVLVVGYLALGELYLLFAPKIQRVAPGATLLVTAGAATIQHNASADKAKLADDGWEAIHRGPALIAIAIGINSLGTLVLVGGLGYSAWRFKQLGIHRNRMIGCLLIALGTIVVGLGGTLTRLGHREYLYIPMSIGVAIIFLGYLQTRAPSPAGKAATAETSAAPVTPLPRNGMAAGAVRSAPTKPAAANGHHPAPAAVPAPRDPDLAFLETNLCGLGADALSELGRVWSVPRPEIDALDRETARRAWALRRQLSPAAQERFDTLPVPVRAQLTALYHEVMQPQHQETGARMP